MNNFAVISQVAPWYAPAGKHLVLGFRAGHTETHRPATRRIHHRANEKLVWPGRAHLAFFEKLQNSACPAAAISRRTRTAATFRRIRPGIYVCGDHRDNASINGAMLQWPACRGNRHRRSLAR